MRWMSLSELSASLDPQYAGKMRHLQQEIQAKYEIAQFQANQQMEAEYFRANQAAQRERERGENMRDAERIRGQNDMALSAQQHEQRIKEMEFQLDATLRQMGHASNLEATQKIMDEQRAARQHFMDQLSARSALRGEVFKMLAGAIIQEKLAQKQHKRDLEKMALESAMRRADSYFSSLCNLVGSLLQKGKEDEAKREIDRLVEEWARA